MYKIKKCPVCGHKVHIHTKTVNETQVYQVKNICNHFSELDIMDSVDSTKLAMSHKNFYNWWQVENLFRRARWLTK